jgi:hypothetical protein
MGEKDINTELWHVNHLEDGEGNRMVKKVAEVRVHWWWALKLTVLNLCIFLPESVDYDSLIFLPCC